MPTPATPSSPRPAGDSRAASVATSDVVPNFEERLRLFWSRNSKAVTSVLVAVVLAILVKGGWEYLQEQRDQDIGRAYSNATTIPQLKTFAAEHPDHPLGAAASLRIADDAYATGKFADAIPAYEKAASVLKEGPLASRARLGAAMSKFEGGRASEGETALKAFVADAKEEKAYRAEALYHLASAAFAAGKTDELKAYGDQLTQLDPASQWTQRVVALRARAPLAPAKNG